VGLVVKSAAHFVVEVKERSALPQEKFITPEEYLALDRAARQRSEYYDGEMFLMAGASRKHNIIAINASTLLNVALRDSPCEVYASDMRTRIRRSANYVYPDVVVACEEPEFDDENADVLLNPTVVVEILSPGTEKRDQGLKFDLYRRAPSLKEYLLLKQHIPHAMLYQRQRDDSWLLRDFIGLESVVPLEAIGCELKLADIYHKVKFKQPLEDELP
jgi:Uma2 family endonuclease